MQGGFKIDDFRPISRYLQNDARQSHYYGRWIGNNRTQAFEWYQFDRHEASHGIFATAELRVQFTRPQIRFTLQLLLYLVM